jgi:hypothetical protein
VAQWNKASLINLLKCGFDIYDPVIKKGGRKAPRDGWIYLWRKL